MNTRRTKKQSYSSREVSQITALKSYVLRYWETEFEELRPKKDRNGNRVYRIEDIKLIFHLKRLLYEDKYTIAGARQRLKALLKNGRQMDLSFERLRKEDAALEIKKGLEEILVLLDQANHRENVSRKVTVVDEPKKKRSLKRVQLAAISEELANSSSNGMHSPTDMLMN